MFRSLLFVPGNRSDMLDKALGLSPDVVVPDMEDSVPYDEKKMARRIVKKYLPLFAELGLPVIPRVNSQDTGLLWDDLDSVVGPHIMGVTVGKSDSKEEVKVVSGMLDDLELKKGMASHSKKLIPWIETAKGVINAYEICKASPRVIAVAFGAEDFTRDMAIQRTEDESEVVYARSVVAVAARAANVLALDTPYVRYQDEPGLEKSVSFSRKLGFTGKFAIHPSQIKSINSGYAPTNDEIEEAKRVIEAFEKTAVYGQGATSLDGRMIDIPIVERARDLLVLAKMVGKEDH